MRCSRKIQFESARSLRHQVSLLSTWVIVFGCLIGSAGSQVTGQTSANPNLAPNRSTKTSMRNQQSTLEPRQAEGRALTANVRIVVEQNRILMIGSEEDLKTVVAAIELVRRKMSVHSNPTISEKVVLKFQLAETVKTIMTNMANRHSTSAPVQITALHFPEAILMVGPASAVQRAKDLLNAIDSHDGFPRTNKSTANTPGNSID